MVEAEDYQVIIENLISPEEQAAAFFTLYRQEVASELEKARNNIKPSPMHFPPSGDIEQLPIESQAEQLRFLVEDIDNVRSCLEHGEFDRPRNMLGAIADANLQRAYFAGVIDIHAIDGPEMQLASRRGRAAQVVSRNLSKILIS